MSRAPGPAAMPTEMPKQLPDGARPAPSPDVLADWASRRERSNAFALRVMGFLAVTLGRRLARLLLHPIAAHYLFWARDARRQSARFLQRALGRPPTWRERYRHFHHFAATVLDRVYLVRGRVADFDVALRGAELVDTALAGGRGAVLLGAHVGSFEALHAVGAGRPGLRVTMAMYPDNARLIHAALQALAPGFALDVVAVGRPGSTLALRDRLDAGGLVGMLGDRHLAADGAGTVELPFLGRPARFADGPLRIAALLRRPVVFMAAPYRGGRRYEIVFEPLADFSGPDGEPAARDAAVRAALVRYVARLEALVRDAPFNWFNFYDYWREDRPQP